MGGLHHTTVVAHARDVIAGDIADEIAKGPRCSIIRLVDLVLADAHARRASDIHLDPRAEHVAVRLRIDGVLHDAHVAPRSMHNELITRIKVLSGLRIDEHHKPQDGRFAALLDAGVCDVRVSIVPTYHGENAVLRILARTQEHAMLEELGFTARHTNIIERATAMPFGLVLVTGPTGSGKTTTLYTLLEELNTPSTSIVTIEDPIEYAIAGINQIQVSARSGISFAEGLRSVLRQDPNVIMVGEIRDRETAALAVNTALTGHLVFSTLHTNDAPTTLVRLLDMGVEPYLIASTVSLAIGQRLVRRVCTACALPRTLAPVEIDALGSDLRTEALHPRAVFVAARGCAECNGTGYYGRIGVHEVMEVRDSLRECVLARPSIGEIRARAREHGMTSIAQDGMRKAARGLTTLEEVMRVQYE